MNHSNCTHEPELPAGNGLCSVSRIWLGADKGLNATRLFRKTISIRDTGALQSARWVVFADAVYHIWVNGHYVGRGPTFFHPHRRPIQCYDVRRWLRSGRNVMAALVHSPGLSLHNYIPSACPGLVCRLDLQFRNGKRRTVRSDGSWKASARTGWRSDSPRRSWAIGFIEHFDAGRHPFGWMDPDFDDSRWPVAEPRAPFRREQPGVYIDPGLPKLRFEFMPVRSVNGVYTVGGKGAALRFNRKLTCAAFGNALLSESWTPARAFMAQKSFNPQTGGFTLRGARASKAIALCFDLGAQYTGGVVFEMESDTGGTLDMGWAELMEHGRPQVMRKGNTYADRFEAKPGRNRWQPIGFSSGRYLLLVVRGFAGTIRFHRFGMLASEPDLSWNGCFRCEKPMLNAIWNLCARTVRVGTQAGIMDCPTREQAAYVNDGNPTADWIARLTGDFSHWRHLVRETFAVQSQTGLIKTTIFSGAKAVLIDLELLAVINARDYLRESGDVATIREILPAGKRLLEGFSRWQDADGLFVFDWEHHYVWRNSLHPYCAKVTRIKNPGTAVAAFEHPLLNVFIDHPGMGWHNVGEPGIDRRGVNAAMNALLAIAYRALGEMADSCGESDGPAWRTKADRSTALCHRFWNAKRGVFADGIRRGRMLKQISQQTNTWCLMATKPDADAARRIMKIILSDKNRTMARSGPYFWHWMLPLMHELGLHREALQQIERRWSVMVKHGATTLWETFAGDELDSYCHPFAAAPLDFLLRSIVGIGPLPDGQRVIELQPRWDLLNEVMACVMTPQGEIRIEWKRRAKEVVASGRLPPRIKARIHLPSGTVIERSGLWQLRIKDGTNR